MNPSEVMKWMSDFIRDITTCSERHGGAQRPVINVKTVSQESEIQKLQNTQLIPEDVSYRYKKKVMKQVEWRASDTVS